MSALTIGKTARAAGVNVETVRFYERRGLIEQPPRPDRSFRQYSTEHIRRIRFIRQAQQLGFSLREITELLALRDSSSADCSEMHARAAMKKEEVLSKIEKLNRIKNVLDVLIAECPRKGELSSCPILAALDEPRG